MIKRAEDQEGKLGEDKLWALKGKGSLEKQKAGGKAARKQSQGMQGEWDSILTERLKIQTEIHTPLDIVLAYFRYDRRLFRQGII